MIATNEKIAKQNLRKKESVTKGQTEAVSATQSYSCLLDERNYTLHICPIKQLASLVCVRIRKKSVLKLHRKE